MKKEIKTIKVADYVEEYNKSHDEKITRHDVYKMIKNGELKAEKDPKGAWLIRVEIEKPGKEYSVKQFVEEYNRRYKDEPITIKKVRELASTGKIKAKKSLGRWIILDSPRKKIRDR